MDQEMLNVFVKNLKEKHYTVSVFDAKEEAADYLCGQIQNSTVGFGGSVTLQQMNLFDRLSARNEVFWHWAVPEGMTNAQVIRREAEAEHYVCSLNGAAATGELINIDGNGNRVAAASYGHKKVWFVMGVNKLAKDYEAALWRARNIAAPKNAQRLKRKTPCAVKGDKCYDCKSPDRLCNALSVLWNKPYGMDYEVVVVKEELDY